MNLLTHRLKGIEIYCGDFRNLKINSAALIAADPMWNESEQFKDLAIFAERVLKPGGRLLLFSGNLNLPEKLNALAQHLNFQLPLGILFSYPKEKLLERLESSGELTKALTHPVKRYIGRSQPGLQFFDAFLFLTLWVKGCWEMHQIKPFYNVFVERGFKKEFHECQQSLEAIRYFVGLLTEPGDLVVETHGGSFTVAQAVRRMIQNAIFVVSPATSGSVVSRRVQNACWKLINECLRYSNRGGDKCPPHPTNDMPWGSPSSSQFSTKTALPPIPLVFATDFLLAI